jgi:S-adenosylmethionine decarboxylase
MRATMFNVSLWVDETKPDVLKETYGAMLVKSGFQVEDFAEKYFKPYGYTALWLLSESHLAIHTFPEENTTYIELSSCVEKQYKSFMAHLARPPA